jgi:predicted RNase H-like HicB family nuclease
VGKLLEHPEIMTQGETLEELEDNMKDAYALMTLEDVPAKHEIKELAMTVPVTICIEIRKLARNSLSQGMMK